MIVFDWNVRVYYEDTDAGGIVYYANYLKFFERARTEWLRAQGIGQQQLASSSGAMFVVRSASIDYFSPAKLDDDLRLTLAIVKLGRASITFEQKAWLGERVLASARVLVACVSVDGVRPCAIPPAVVAKISRPEPTA
jgi:acyl-CoA thioester hydrolase